MHLTALLGLRVANRRTLAQWTAIDFAAAVAVGAIVGRTAVASTEPLLVGVAALLVLLLAHAVVTFGGYVPWLAKLTDHRVHVLVADGRLRRGQLLVCGLTEAGVYSQLRQQGVYDLATLRYVLYETKGELTVVRTSASSDVDAALARTGLEDAVGGEPDADEAGAQTPRRW